MRTILIRAGMLLLRLALPRIHNEARKRINDGFEAAKEWSGRNKRTYEVVIENQLQELINRILDKDY